MESIDSRRVLEILYMDFAGEMSKVRILPRLIRFGKASRTVEEQWLLEALDVDSGAERVFVLKDVQAYLPTELMAAPF